MAIRRKPHIYILPHSRNPIAGLALTRYAHIYELRVCGVYIADVLADIPLRVAMRAHSCNLRRLTHLLKTKHTAMKYTARATFTYIFTRVAVQCESTQGFVLMCVYVVCVKGQVVVYIGFHTHTLNTHVQSTISVQMVTICAAIATQSQSTA